MNKLFLFSIFFAYSFLAFSQSTAPSAFNVQFSLRRANGATNPNKPILVKATIYKNTGAIYEKIFSETSNPFGIVSLKVEGPSTNSQFPSANDFANNNLSLSIAVDTTNIGGNFFDIYSQQLFAAVPYAIAAQKAPGTFDYQYDDSESGDVSKGINRDVLFQNDTLNPNFFPRLFFNKKGNAWLPTEKSYSMLPNNLNNLNRTIFFNITNNPNLKPRWEINQALTLTNNGLGINLPVGSALGNAFEVFGSIRFATLNTTGINRMVVVDPNGNLSNQAIPNIVSGLPNGGQGDLLFFDNNIWVPNSSVQIKNGSLFSAKNVNVSDTVFSNHFKVNSDVIFNSLNNPQFLDSTQFLTTNTVGKVILQKVKFPAANVGLQAGTQGDLLFYNNSIWSPTSALKIINNSLLASKNINVTDTLFSSRLNVSNDIVFNSVSNPQFLDSTLFLTTNALGKVILQKVKFPASSGSLQAGTQGDLLFYNNGVWSPTSALKVINNSLLASKNINVVDTLFSSYLNVSNDVVFNNVSNPQFLDSTQFLTTNSIGKVILQKVKFPISGGALQAGTQGDLLFYDNGVWSPTSALKVINNSLFAIKNIKVTDTLFTKYASISNNLNLQNYPNPLFLDSTQFLTTDQNGNVVLQKVKIPTTVPVTATIKNKFITVTGANQSYNLNDTSRIYIAHNAIGSGTYTLNLPLASAFPNQRYEVVFGRPVVGQKPDFQVVSSSGLADIYNFQIYSTVNAFFDNSNINLRITMTSTFINGSIGYKWVLVRD
jgi:hypothetical protein